MLLWTVVWSPIHTAGGIKEVQKVQCRCVQGALKDSPRRRHTGNTELAHIPIKKNKKNEGKMITTFNKHHHGLLRIPGPAGTTNDLLRVKRQIYIFFFIFIIVPNAFLLPKPASQRKHCSPIGNVYPHPLSHPLQRAAQSSLL